MDCIGCKLWIFPEQHIRIDHLYPVIEVHWHQDHQLMPENLYCAQSDTEAPLCGVQRGRVCEFPAKLHQQDLRYDGDHDDSPKYGVFEDALKHVLLVVHSPRIDL